jgi:hypothetical protein
MSGACFVVPLFTVAASLMLLCQENFSFVYLLKHACTEPLLWGKPKPDNPHTFWMLSVDLPEVQISCCCAWFYQ